MNRYALLVVIGMNTLWYIPNNSDLVRLVHHCTASSHPWHWYIEFVRGTKFKVMSADDPPGGGIHYDNLMTHGVLLPFCSCRLIVQTNIAMNLLLYIMWPSECYLLVPTVSLTSRLESPSIQRSMRLRLEPEKVVDCCSGVFAILGEVRDRRGMWYCYDPTTTNY